MLGVYILIGILAIIFTGVLYHWSPKKIRVRKKNDHKILLKKEDNGSNVMEKQKQTQPIKKIEASDADRVNQIIAAIDEKIKDFDGNYAKVEDWIKANVKAGVDGYHAGFYLCQCINQARLYSWADVMVFGPQLPREDEEPQEEQNKTVFDAGPVDTTTPFPKQVKADVHDSIADFLDQEKKKADGVEVG